MAEEKTKDLGLVEHPELSWESGQALSSLEALFQHIRKEAELAIRWYLVAKRPKKRWVMLLRAGAIAAGSIAGIIPMLAQIFSDNGTPKLQPAWASVALGVAAALVLLDRFFGFSSAWMRYITTELNIRQMTQEFYLEWVVDKAAWGGAEPDRSQLQATLARFKLFVTRLNMLLRKETNEWVQEFQSTLKQIDDSAKAKAAATELGALNITVTNGDEYQTGWTLFIDDGSGRNAVGKTAGVRDLLPGTHLIAAEGNINGNKKRAEAAVTIAAGSVSSVQLTLN